jgi:hypothetical protein
MNFFRFFVFSAMMFGVYLVGPELNAQTAPDGVATMTERAATNWRIERAKLDLEYEKKLLELEQWCSEKKGAFDTVIEPYKRTLHRDLNRQFIFIPSEQTLVHAAPAELDLRLHSVNQWQAQRIFELAKRALDADAAGTTIQLLNEVLFFDHDHAEVRRILSHKKTDKGWVLYPDRISIRKATREQELCHWPAKSYLVANTPNFQIESNGSEEQMQQLAESLERWHYVWRQVYFAYWGNAKLLRRWIGGDGSFSYGRRKFRVVFFRDRKDYLNLLGPQVPGIEISTGYYSNPKNCSFFYYTDEPAGIETWKHEVTHQLFRESIGSGKNLKLFENEWVWLDEGAATYAESLTDFGDYVTLGGFDARRMQYARVRLLLEGYQVPLAELNQLGRLGLQQRPDIVRLYGQIAGQFDMLMNDRAGANEAQVITALQSLYRGKSIKPEKFEALFGSTLQQLDQQYRAYLIVDTDSIVKHLAALSSRTELSFAKSKLNDKCFSIFGQCRNLIWLDVSGNRIHPDLVGQLKTCSAMQQLIMTQCPLEPGALRALSKMPQLSELDLSGSSVTDQQLLELQGQANLSKLLLKSTNVTDAGAAKLKQLLPKLKIVR